MTDYTDFLRQKIKLARFNGFDVPAEAINPALKPHTRDIVRWAVQGGNRAIFASFGLHKTATQLEIMRLVGEHRPGLRLIERYSSRGELVYDPFCGLGTVPYRAILKGRRGGGSELSATYFRDQVHYLQAAEREVSMPALFDLEAMDEAQPEAEAA